MPQPRLAAQRMQMKSITDHDETTALRWEALSARLGMAMPGQWTRADLDRGYAIIKAEEARSTARAAIMAEVAAAYRQYPHAATAGEACALTGLDPAEITRRLWEVPPPDDIGLQWLITAFERAEREGALVFLANAD